MTQPSAGGKGPLDRLLRIFNGFEIPTYLIFDGDKENDDKTKELIELHFDSLESSEGLETRVENSYAVFFNNFDSTLEKELNQNGYDRDNLVQEVREEKSVPKGKKHRRKPLRNKFLSVKIKQIKEETGENIVPKTIRKIISKIKSLEFEGSILR